MRRKVEFYVSGVVVGPPGFLHLIGRNCEDTVRIGDTLDAVYRRQEGDASGIRSLEKAVALTVARLQAYEQELEELPPGMTGRVSLTGTGGDEVSPGCLLGAAVLEGNVVKTGMAGSRAESIR